MKKVLYNQLVDQYAAYNLQYQEICDNAPDDIDKIAYIAGKCDVLYKLTLVNVRLTPVFLNYLKVEKDLCERDYRKAMEHYNDERAEYVYLNCPTYYKGCIEIYTDVIEKLSKELNKDICL